jgi:prepilin-type N-terminal cleavage/methylation domain-containing protein
MIAFKPNRSQSVEQRLRLARLLAMARYSSNRSEQGVTLLECLVAIMVIAVTVAAITPPLFVSVATRVQNQRAEQAQQLAQQEIDRVRILVERGAYDATNYTTILPPAATGLITGVAAPTTAPPQNSNLNDRAQATSATRAYVVDVDRDGREDFLVQIFRDQGVNGVSGSPPPIGFRMGVRVYSSQARPRLGSLLTDTATLKFVTGQGQQITRPLAVLYTQIARSDSRNSLRQQCLLLGGTNCPAQ